MEYFHKKERIQVGFYMYLYLFLKKLKWKLRQKQRQRLRLGHISFYHISGTILEWPSQNVI